MPTISRPAIAAEIEEAVQFEAGSQKVPGRTSAQKSRGLGKVGRKDSAWEREELLSKVGVATGL